MRTLLLFFEKNTEQIYIYIFYLQHTIPSAHAMVFAPQSHGVFLHLRLAGLVLGLRCGVAVTALALETVGTAGHLPDLSDTLLLREAPLCLFERLGSLLLCRGPFTQPNLLPGYR